MVFHEAWQIRTRSRICSATGISFTDGQSIITAIFPDPDSSGYLRKDFSEEAWSDLNKEVDRPFSYWKSRFTVTSQTENLQAVTKQGAEELLRSLVEDDLEHSENTRYILALMLERQKLLRETDAQPTPSGILRIYEHRKTGEVFIVKDPNIPLDQVEKIQEEVILLLAPQN